MAEPKKIANYSKPAKVGLVLGSLILLYGGVKALSQPKLVPINWGNVPTTSPGILWDPAPLAAEIEENICGGYNFFTYPETAQKILDLQTDDQVKLLYNQYLAQYGGSLVECLESEWDDWSGTYDAAVIRMRSVGLSDNIIKKLTPEIYNRLVPYYGGTVGRMRMIGLT